MDSNSKRIQIVIAGVLLILLVSFVVHFGYRWGYSAKLKDEATRQDALVTTSCPAPRPPSDDSFGATTTAYLTLLGTYRECLAAIGIK